MKKPPKKTKAKASRPTLKRRRMRFEAFKPENLISTPFGRIYEISSGRLQLRYIENKLFFPAH